MLDFTSQAEFEAALIWMSEVGTRWACQVSTCESWHSHHIHTDSSWCWYKHPVYETLWSNWLTMILEVFPQNLTWTYLKQAGFFFFLLQKIQINTTENKVKYRPNTLCRFNIKRKSQFDSPAKSVQVHQSPVLLAWAHVPAPRKTKPSLYFTSGLIHNLKPDVITSCGYGSSDTSTLFFLLGAVCWETCMCYTESARAQHLDPHFRSILY